MTKPKKIKCNHCPAIVERLMTANGACCMDCKQKKQRERAIIHQRYAKQG